LIKVISNAVNTEITLTPNRSLSTKQSQWVVFAVCTFVFLIALFWSARGAFFVLPFAGLDILLFAYFMFKINQKGLRKQLITIDSEKVLIESGKIEVEKSLSLLRDDAYVVVTDPIGKKPLSLKLSDSNSYVELGSFLTSSDKTELRKSLQKAGLREINQQWWKLNG